VNDRFAKSVRKLDQGGFTLIELIIIIVVLGILAAVAAPKFANILEGSKAAATREELQTMKEAIIGNLQVVSSGVVIDRGFVGDVGFVPSQLVDLVVKPGSVSVYNRLTRLGWNGPYVDGDGNEYLTDAWGGAYSYDPVGRKIVSTGGPDSITITF
jgi:prepilin-type N-terminal cleavage/methylation domain-containing protein